MTTTTRTRPPLQPAQGSFRWLQQPDARGEGGVLRINDTVYLLSPVRQDRRVNKEQPVIGWKLTKADTSVYEIYPDRPHWTCDCADFVFNRDRAETPLLRVCKHVRCLQKALPLAGQNVAAEQP